MRSGHRDTLISKRDVFHQHSSQNQLPFARARLLSGWPAASETLDSANSSLSRKFRKPLVTSNQHWSQWETDKGKKRRRARYQISLAKLFHYYNLQGPIFPTNNENDTHYEKQINSLLFNRCNNRTSSVWGPLPLIVSVCTFERVKNPLV